jgi:hypothetical protein
VSDVPDDVLLPVRERLRDWEDFDVAGFYLGKALGVIPPEDSFRDAKGLFWSAREDGMKLLDMVQFLVDQGFLEQRDPLGEYGEYRWRADPKDSDSSIAEDG